MGILQKISKQARSNESSAYLSPKLPASAVAIEKINPRSYPSSFQESNLDSVSVITYTYNDDKDDPTVWIAKRKRASHGVVGFFI